MYVCSLFLFIICHVSSGPLWCLPHSGSRVSSIWATHCSGTVTERPEEPQAFPMPTDHALLGQILLADTNHVLKSLLSRMQDTEIAEISCPAYSSRSCAHTPLEPSQPQPSFSIIELTYLAYAGCENELPTLGAPLQSSAFFSSTKTGARPLIMDLGVFNVQT